MSFRDRLRVLTSATFAAFCHGLYVSMPVVFTEGDEEL